jgi:hypothetical protein
LGQTRLALAKAPLLLRPCQGYGIDGGVRCGTDRKQSTLLPECLDDWVDDRNPIRVMDAFVDALDLRKLGYNRAAGSSARRLAISK